MLISNLQVIVMLVALHSGIAAAEIYQWTDEEGNLHFGDKPLDSGSAAKAKAVELKPGYEPIQRTDDEQAVFETQQQTLKQANAARRSAEQEKRDEVADKRREEQVERCSRLKKRVKRLSQLEVDADGNRRFYYDQTADGKSVTVAETKEIVAGLHAEIDKEGC